MPPEREASYIAGTSPSLAVMVTRRCNMTCGHCSVESSPRVRAQPSEERLLAVVNEMAQTGMTAVLFTGGEPMLRQSLLIRLLKAAKKGGMKSAMATNGFWAKTVPEARATLSALHRAGLDRFTLSYDRYHAEFQGPEPGINLLKAAEELDIPMNVNVTRVADDSEMATLVEPFEHSRHARLRVYDVQPIGRARSFEPSSLRAELDGMCNAATTPAVTDDMRVTACNGPSYFMRSDSPLVLGSLDDTTLTELIRRHRDDPILDTIRVFGPRRLQDELRQIPGFEDFPFKAQYGGMCELCLDINSNPAAVRVLRERLSEPQIAAERAARRRVIEGARERRELGFDHANGVGAARLWFDGAAASTAEGRQQIWGADARRVFGRSDFDWKRAADYLGDCGLTRAVVPILDDPELQRWAPSIFAPQIKRSAMAEATRELLQVEALRRIDAELETMGTTGLLLKGAALLAIDRAHNPLNLRSGVPRRSAGDIDLVADGRHAIPLRTRLLANGFTGDSAPARTGPHHLGAVLFRGVSIEIHTRIMPRLWRLPENEMLERARGISGFSRLSVLDNEGLMLHALVHSTAHLFAHGLKAAWDVAWIMGQSTELDWDRLGRWAKSTAMPAAFFIPATVFGRELGIGFPESLIEARPRGTRIESIECVASLRLFSAMEGAFDLNPITKNGFFLLLHPGWRDRFGYARMMLGTHEREARRVSRTQGRAGGNGHYRGVVGQLRESMGQWSAYRRNALAAVRRQHELEEERLFSAL